MIVFNRLNGKAIALNPDLIERVESTPDTVVTLVNDRKLLVSETLEQVLTLIADYRAFVLARSQNLVIVDQPRPTLHVVPNELAMHANGDDGELTDNQQQAVIEFLADVEDTENS